MAEAPAFTMFGIKTRRRMLVLPEIKEEITAANWGPSSPDYSSHKVVYKPQEPDYSQEKEALDSIKLANALPLDEGQDKPNGVLSEKRNEETYESSPVVGRVLSKALPKEWKKAHPYGYFATQENAAAINQTLSRKTYWKSKEKDEEAIGSQVNAAFGLFKEQMEAKYSLLSAFVAEFLRSGPNAKATPTNVYTLWLTGVPKKVYERPDLEALLMDECEKFWNNKVSLLGSDWIGISRPEKYIGYIYVHLAQDLTAQRLMLSIRGREFTICDHKFLPGISRSHRYYKRTWAEFSRCYFS